MINQRFLNCLPTLLPVSFFSMRMSALICLAVLTSFCGHVHAADDSKPTTESIAVRGIAPGSPGWMAELARADDYREPTTSPAVKNSPFSELRIGAALPAGPVYHQPSGALSGKTIFAMAGHGWTYDSDEMYYYTQRGLSQGMVEDLGNADQMHIFAHLVFNAGATVVPFRPVDHQPNERILDNTMPQVQFFGDWRAGSNDRYFGNPDDGVHYAVAKASLQETAVARFRPYIPESGYYPVYVWARDGADRADQLYRIVHAGGMAELRVDWRRQGKAWVWLGTYYFNQGDSGFVETSNQVIDPYTAYGDNVVVADAVRFGNGQGDVPRPGGISGFGREDEGDCYWIQRSLGVGADRRLYDIGSDGNSTVSSPPKAAAHVNRENTGSYLDRLLISFHSNASTGNARGAIALYNDRPVQRPTYQEDLAQILGAEVNAQMRAERPPAGDAWSDRERDTYSGIDFGELRRDYVQNEMAATIVEVAFHDNPEDARFLLDPRSRIAMAEATLRGILRWHSAIEAPGAVALMPPSRPAAIAATVKDNQIHLVWEAGKTGQFNGGPAASFRVYRSHDGLAFDGGTDVASEKSSAIVDGLTTSGVTFLRLTAVNKAGESFPSQTIAVSPGTEITKGNSRKSQSPTLLVAANTQLDSSTNVPYKLDLQPGGPYREGQQTQRVRALYTMVEPSGAAEAIAAADAGIAFDGADSAALESGLIRPSDYKRLIYTTEQQQPTDPLISEKVQGQLSDFIGRGGKLLLTGSGLASNLAASGKASARFLSDTCGITGQDEGQPGSILTSTDNRFLTTTLEVALSDQNRPWAAAKPISPTALHIKKERSIGLLEFTGYQPGNLRGFAAALTRPTWSEGEVLVLGFPLSLVKDAQIRTSLMQAMLKQL